MAMLKKIFYSIVEYLRKISLEETEQMDAFYKQNQT
jgi:hypothetical protein